MLVNMIGTLPALRMRGLHDKRHLLAKLHICDSKNSHSFGLGRGLSPGFEKWI